VWTALYDGADTVNGMTLSAMLVYLTIANLQNRALQDIDVSLYLQSRAREGKVAFDLLLPQPFVGRLDPRCTGFRWGLVGRLRASLSIAPSANAKPVRPIAAPPSPCHPVLTRTWVRI
jgi:hypothetical protein